MTRINKELKKKKKKKKIAVASNVDFGSFIQSNLIEGLAMITRNQYKSYIGRTQYLGGRLFCFDVPRLEITLPAIQNKSWILIKSD